MATELAVRDNIDFATDGLSPVRGTPLKINDTWTRGYDKEALDTNQDFLLADASEAWQF